MPLGFVHLRLHTEYSLIDSVVRVPELSPRSAAAGMPAVAVTDQNNLFAMVKFYRAALAAGMKPIIGVDLLVREEGERQRPLAPDAAVPDPGRLPQSRPAGEPRLPGRPGARRFRASSAPGLRPENVAGLIALSGASRGRYRAGAAATRASRRPSRRSIAGSGSSPSASTSSCSASAARRGGLHQCSRGAGRAARRAGGRHQRRALPQSRGV